MLLQMERCPRCQAPLAAQPAQPPEGYFGTGRRERPRDRGDVGDRSAARQERASLEGELKGEGADVGRQVTRSELDRYAKGPDEHVPGGPAPTAHRPTAYQNPYLDRQDLPDPRAQFQPPGQAVPPLQPRSPLGGPAETVERMGMASIGTHERAGLGAAGFATTEFIMDGRLPELREADELGFQLLGIDMRRLQTTLCENPQEWEEKMLAGAEISPAMKAALVQGARADRSVRGVFLPAKGLFVNGSAFADPLGADKPQVVSTAIHEKLGHGFCNTYTLKGEEESRAGSALFRLASTFGLKQIDEPLYPLWVQKKNVSLRSSFFLEEGFASYVQHRLVRAMARAHPGAGYERIPTHATTLEDLLGQLSRVEQAGGSVPIAYRNLDDYLVRWMTNEAERLREEGKLDYQGSRLETLDQVARLASTCLEMLVGDGGTSPRRAAGVMMALEAADRLLSDAHSTGLQLRYEGGFLLMERLERLFGERCVPAAVRIAGNVRYNLAAVSVDDLMKATSDANYNCDARLASILRLGGQDVPKNDARRFAQVVNQALGFSVPEGV